MSADLSQYKKCDFDKKLSARLELILEEMDMNMKSFSIKAGKSPAWCQSVIKRKGALKARDLHLLEKVYRINPNYIVLGEEPMFLEKESGSFKGETL